MSAESFICAMMFYGCSCLVRTEDSRDGVRWLTIITMCLIYLIYTEVTK